MRTGKELKNRGLVLFQERKYEEAADKFRQAVAAFAEEDDPEQVAEMKVNLGLCLRNLEQYENALEEMEEGLSYFRETGNELREAQALSNMAPAYAELGDAEQAETFYRTAAAIFQELDEDEAYGEVMLGLADMQFRNGEYVHAVGTYEQGLQYIRNKTHRQRMLKQLMVAKNAAFGMPSPEGPDGDGADSQSDSRRRRKKRGLGGLFQRGDDDGEDE